jgi:hypothetical protein
MSPPSPLYSQPHRFGGSVSSRPTTQNDPIMKVSTVIFVVDLPAGLLAGATEQVATQFAQFIKLAVMKVLYSTLNSSGDWGYVAKSIRRLYRQFFHFSQQFLRSPSLRPCSLPDRYFVLPMQL